MPPDESLDLILERLVPVSALKIWRCWTESDLLVQWFAPFPWSARDARLDVKPGGVFSITMQSPEGEDMPCSGCYLMVEPPKRLVWTDALLADFRPSPHPFFTAELTLEEKGENTLYRVVAKHKDGVTRQQHEEMGFHSGWGVCLDQLVACANRL